MPDRLSSDPLLQAVLTLSSARERAAIAAAASAAARQLTHADGAAFVLREDDLLYYAAEDAVAPLWQGRRFPLGQCITGWVIRHAAPVAIADIIADERIAQERYRRTFVRGLLALPVGSNPAIGALVTYWSAVHEATADERQVLEPIADAAAQAFAHAEVVRDLRRSLAHEREARAKSERAGRLKDDLLAALSQQLRTPLDAIQGWLWRLRQPDLPAAELRRGIEIIERNTALERQIVHDLAGASRTAAVAAPASPLAGTYPAARLDGVTVLLVDDEAEACEAVSRILRQYGARTLTATSAAHAINLLRRETPDIIVADLATPGAEAYALLERVRALSEEARKIPAAVLSAQLASEHRQLAERAGFQMYLEKPIPPDELASKLAELAGARFHIH